MLLLFFAAALAQTPNGDGAQQVADLGDFKLRDGQVIRDCRVGYRTLGKLNAAKSNAVLIPTWFEGRSGDLVDQIGPGKLVDTRKYFVILVDALGDGISSSPSNSTSQPHMKFPQFTIEDMVESQHALLTRFLHIEHLRAVVGISMGGIQTYQWSVAYPDFMDRLVPIVGSPRMTPHGLLFLQTVIDAIEHSYGWNGGDYREQPAARQVQELTDLLLSTPQHYNAETTREAFFASLKHPGLMRFDDNDIIRQAQAIMAFDLGSEFGGPMASAAAAVKAPMLVIVDSHDQMVNPEPAIEFAKMTRAQALVLENDCGHLGPGCESVKVSQAIAAFLEK